MAASGPVARGGWLADAIVRLHARRMLHQRDVMDRPLLDTVRWMSAFMVVIGHVMGLVFTRQSVAQPGTLGIVDMISDLRGPSVTFFFVLSGYLVGGGVLARAAHFDLRRYAIARFARIYIVLVPAILLICMLDGAAHRIDPQSPVYAQIWPSGVLGQAPIDDRYRPINWIVTVLSLESVVAQPAGTGNALWSLGYEWAFYFVFPALVIPFARFRSLLVPLLPIVAVLILLLSCGRKLDAGLFAIWIAGAYARVVVDHAAVPRALSWAGALIAAAALLASVVRPSTTMMIVMGLGFALYLARFAPGERGLSPQIDRRLADWSYSLYVTHFPVAVFLTFLANRAGWLPRAGLAGGVEAVLLTAAFTLAALTVAFVFGTLFERRTDRLRLWLGRVTA